MTQAAHTSGPWTLDAFDDYVDGTDMEVLDPDGFTIATIESSPIINRWTERFPTMSHWADGADDGLTQRHREQGELHSTARLIAAAPELLEALEEAIEWDGCDSEGIDAVWLQKARAAIAKARRAA